MVSKMELISLLTLILISIQVASGHVYTPEGKWLPLKALNEINQKFLKAAFVPDVGISQLSPHSKMMGLETTRKLNSSHFRELLGKDLINSINLLDLGGVSECSRDLVQIIFNLESIWAISMLDSSGKLASGLLLGAISWPGSYRECQSVKAPLDSKGRGGFRGKYCVASWLVQIPQVADMNITSGICVPDSCSNNYMENVVHVVMHLTGQTPFLKKYDSVLSLNSITCKSDPNPPDAGTVIYIVILCLLLFMVVLGSMPTVIRYFIRVRQSGYYSNDLQQQFSSTSYGSIQVSAKSEQLLSDEKISPSCDADPSDDCDSRKIAAVGSKAPSTEKKSWLQFLKCFSMFDNAAKVLEIKENASQLQSIHGIRFLSLTWIILGHTYISGATYISNKSEVLEDIDNFPFQMVLQAPFAVDSFFVLSGLLLTYLFLKEAEKKNGKINWIYFYVHRIWRLTPLYLLVVGFYMLIFKYLGSGPFWNESYGDSNRNTWWYYVLYINNFIPIKDMCLGWSWYLANDMQFYIISPLFLYPLWRWPKIGISIAVSLIFGSVIVTAVLSSQNDLTPFLADIPNITHLQEYEDKMWHSFDVIYDKPYCRIGAYLIGALCGYLIYKSGSNKNFLRPWHQLYGWIAAVFYSAIVIFGIYRRDMSGANSTAYNSLSRCAFSIGLSWLIFACETGHGGLVTKLLSMKFWIPLSRLTYSAYLIHPILIHKYYMGLPTMMYFSHFIMVTNFLGFLLISYALAFVVSICFESPLMNIEKLLLKR